MVSAIVVRRLAFLFIVFSEVPLECCVVEVISVIVVVVDVVVDDVVINDIVCATCDDLPNNFLVISFCCHFKSNS